MPEEIEQFIMLIPAQREEALQTIAEQFVAAMKLHLLRITVIFYQRAEQEGIAEEERDETLQGTREELHNFGGLTYKITVNTLEALARLGEITVSILDLSQCSSAEAAQSWLYDLPVIYQESLVLCQCSSDE